MSRTSRTAGRSLSAAERRKQALELRRTGASYQKIADTLGMTKAAAHKTVTKALSEIEQDTLANVPQVRALELERLDRMQMTLWRQGAINGNHGAIDRILRIMERRSRLLGLDAPTRVAPTDPGGDKPYSDPAHEITDDERAQRLLQLLAKGRDSGAAGAE